MRGEGGQGEGGAGTEGGRGDVVAGVVAVPAAVVHGAHLERREKKLRT